MGIFNLTVYLVFCPLYAEKLGSDWKDRSFVFFYFFISLLLTGNYFLFFYIVGDNLMYSGMYADFLIVSGDMHPLFLWGCIWLLKIQLEGFFFPCLVIYITIHYLKS